MGNYEHIENVQNTPAWLSKGLLHQELKVRQRFPSGNIHNDGHGYGYINLYLTSISISILYIFIDIDGYYWISVDIKDNYQHVD